MKRWIGAAFAAGILALTGAASAEPAAAAPKLQAETGVKSAATDFSARRVYRRYAYRPHYRPYYRPYYYARPSYYRPHPYYSPAPFTFGFGFGPLGWY